jgi:endonuclease III related protein
MSLPYLAHHRSPITNHSSCLSSKKHILKEGFDRLLARFGPRGWWPGDTPFEVMVGAVLTQNTSWKNVERAIANLKDARLLDPRAILDLPPARLAALLRPAGFYRVKSHRLRSFLRFFVERYDGCDVAMRRGALPALRDELLAVKGIGPETADSILLYALEKPIFVVDAYTKRILSRHGLCAEEDGYDELQALFMGALPHEVPLFNEYHALLVECGKEFCRTTSRCAGCPLNGWNGTDGS